MTETGARPTVVCIDLDRTIIYSPRALLLPHSDHENPRLLGVETLHGTPQSFVTERAGGLLRELAAACVLVPTTTRTPKQLHRVDLPGVGRAPRYAIASNGGHLLVDGHPDEDWNEQVRRSLDGCATVEEVRHHVQRRRGDFVEKLRVASDLFVYCVVDRAELPSGWVAELTHWCAERGWGVSVQGRKVYAVPRPLTKSSAAREVMRRTGADHLVAAGDSLLDAELLATADRAVRPTQGELADEDWTTPGLHVTQAPGVLGGEELVGWLLHSVVPLRQERTLGAG